MCTYVYVSPILKSLLRKKNIQKKKINASRRMCIFRWICMSRQIVTHCRVVFSWCNVYFVVVEDLLLLGKKLKIVWILMYFCVFLVLEEGGGTRLTLDTHNSTKIIYKYNATVLPPFSFQKYITCTHSIFFVTHTYTHTHENVYFIFNVERM